MVNQISNSFKFVKNPGIKYPPFTTNFWLLSFNSSQKNKHLSKWCEDFHKITCRYDFSSVTTILQTSWLLSSPHLLLFIYSFLNIYQNSCQTVNDCIRVRKKYRFKFKYWILLRVKKQTLFELYIKLWAIFSRLASKEIYSE